MRGLAKGAKFMGRAFSKVLGVAGIIGGVIVAIQALEQMRTKSFDVVMTILKMVDKMINVVGQSAFGNRCKVEVISRSDLLRARGFKVD